MAELKFSTNEALRFGWETMKNNFVFFVILFLIMFFISAIPSALNAMMENLTREKTAASYMAAFFIFIISLGFQAVQMIMQIGLLKISLKFCDRQTPDYSELYKIYRLFWRYLGASLLVGLVVLGGFILFIVPGIIWAIKYSQVNYLIVDRNYEVMAAFKKSGEMTAGSKWQLFVFFLVLGLVNFLGLLCLGVGLFATIPTSAVAMAFVYRQLFHHAQASPIPAVAAGSRPTPIMPGPGGIQI